MIKSDNRIAFIAACALAFLAISSFLSSSDYVRDNSSYNRSAMAVPKKRKVAFMFLMGGSKGLESLWEDWFNSASSPLNDAASIYVHVSDPSTRHSSTGLGPLFASKVIPSVPTEHYVNLFDAMMQLLLYAYADPNNTHFVFISDSSIPVKSFDDTYEELVNERRSRVCLADDKKAKETWERFPQPGIPVHHQRFAEMWMTLNRVGASVLIESLPLTMEWQRMNADRQTKPGPKAGAPDELFPATILQLTLGSDAFATCHGDLSKKDEWRGCCPTYTMWPRLEDIRKELAPSLEERCLDISASSPCAYAEVDAKNLQQIADGGFLFLRKVEEDAVFVKEDGQKIPLKEGLLPLLADRQRKAATVVKV